MDRRFQLSLLEGDFGSGPGWLNSLVEGDFWCRRSGAYLLYRGIDSIAAIDLDHPVCVIDRAGVFTLPESLDHPVGREVWYLLRRVGPAGKQENNTTALVCVRRRTDGVLCAVSRMESEKEACYA